MKNQKSFNQRCYELLKKVPAGKVTTYQDLAHALGTRAYRAVGNAMNKNPDSFLTKGDVPCHRVVKSNGEIGGFASGPEDKIKLLKKEGVKIENGKVDLAKYSFNFNRR